MSPGLIPPRSAGLPRCTPATSTPAVVPSLNDSASSDVISCNSTPTQPRVTAPVSINCSITCLAVETGIAKPDADRSTGLRQYRVLMPTRLPEVSMSAPPEFP